MTTPSPPYRASQSPDFNQAHELDIVAADGLAEPLGRAQLAGWILSGPKPVATYRLIIDQRELSGLFIHIGKQFQHVVA